MCKGDYSVLHFWFKLVNNLIVIRCKNAKILKNPNQKHALKLVSCSYLDILLLYCIQVYHVSLDKNRDGLGWWCYSCKYICRETVLSDFFYTAACNVLRAQTLVSYCRSGSTLFSECQSEESSWTHERAVCKYVVLWLWSVTQTEAVLTFSLNDYFIWKQYSQNQCTPAVVVCPRLP